MTPTDGAVTSAGVVKSHAAGRQPTPLLVQVGALRQVVPDSLSFCWTLIRSLSATSAIASRYSIARTGCGRTKFLGCRGEEFLVTSVEIGDCGGVETSKGVQHG